MQVEVRLFALAREMAGCDRLLLDIPAGANIGEVRASLIEQIPALGPLKDLLLFAVNGRYAEESTPLGPQSRIACFPPVGGG